MTVIGAGSLARRRSVPDSTAFYDRNAALYAAFRLHVFPDDRREVAAALELDHARRFAEIGCGPGFYATAFAAAYPHLAVTGIDQAPAQLAIARRRARGLANVAFVPGDVRALGLWRGLFDRIIAARLLMIVPERDLALAQMYRALASGGRLVLAEPLTPPRISVLRLMQGLTSSSDAVRHAREHVCTGAEFVTLVQSQQWNRVTFWQGHGHRYACCVK